MKFKLSIITFFIWQIAIGNCLFSQVLIPSKDSTPNIHVLNGSWKFKYIAGSKIGSDSLFSNPGFDVSKWSDIKVPGNWELQGFDEPIYGKKLKDGMGLYRRDFSIPTDWKGNPIYVAFDGVQSGYTIWVNGKYAGSFASSFNRQTFDISSLVLVGKTNTLAVRVITHPKGWEFDTNDDWSLSGIFRDVTLFSLTPVHIKDVVIKTFVKKENASIDIKAVIEKSGKAKISKRLKIYGQLVDATGKTVKEFAISADKGIDVNGLAGFTERLIIENPKLWSAETPYLYTLRLSLKDKNRELQQYTERVGIREISWTDGVLKLNGSPIKLKGVNHHDLSPIYGRAITEPEMVEDMKLMRKANINFIRLCHYPPQPRFLELCDSLGMYVMDEIPYGFGEEHLKDSTYLPILKLRAQSTIARDKNRPCVIIWSVGNENPVTEIGLKTGRYVKMLDNTRPYCFPQTPTDFGKMIKAIPDSIDILDDHYPKVDDLDKFATMFDRPLIVSEYAHALGLDFGSMEKMYEIMYANPKIAGGAVWGFFDQGILRKSPKKITKGDSTFYAWISEDMMYDTGGNQGADGIVYANRIPQTDYFQVRKVYTPVKAIDDTLLYKSGKQVLKVKLNNRYDFKNLSELKCSWRIFADTLVINSGTLALKGEPHETIIAAINIELPETPQANFYYLKLMFTDNENIQVYEKTYELQQKNSKSILNQLSLHKLSKPIKKDNVVATENYNFELLKDFGDIQLTNKSGDVIISEGPFARVGRKSSIAIEATTSSRRSKTEHTLWSPFLLSKPEAQIKSFNAKQLSINYKYKPDLPEDRSLSVDITYSFSDSGSIHVDYRLIPMGKEEAVDAGLSFVIPSSFTQFRWVGKGPYAAYPGKDRLSEFGIYQLNSTDLYFTGNRQNVECAVFTNEKGDGFVLIAKNANISVDRTEAGIVVSHNAHVSGCFNKYEWPDDLCSLDGKEIKGAFTLVPFTTATWPSVLQKLFGDAKKTTKAFQPFYHSYDQ